MCSQKITKIYQQTFTYDGTGTFHSVDHHFNRVYKSKPEQYFKIKPIYVSTTEPLLMRNFSKINALCNFDETNGTKVIASSNHFFLGSSSTNHSIEMIVDDINISDFTISYENGLTLDKYTIVFQIELYE